MYIVDRRSNLNELMKQGFSIDLEPQNVSAVKAVGYC